MSALTPAHYLTFSCFNKQWLFKGEPLYTLFIDQLQKARERYHFKLFGFVVMPNHVHLLLDASPEVTISEILNGIRRPFAFHALNWLDERFPELKPLYTVKEGKRTKRRFWTPGHGYDKPVTTRDAVHHMINYMHNNPVKRELVEEAEQWRWSSARFWLTGEADPLKMDDPW